MMAPHPGGGCGPECPICRDERRDFIGYTSLEDEHQGECDRGRAIIEAGEEGQRRWHSFVESWVNILVGLGVSALANWILFPLFGWHISAKQNATLVVIYTAISFVRSYLLRRLFNRWHVEDARKRRTK